MKMLTLCVCLLTLFVSHSFSQKTKKVVENTGDKYNNTSESYFVLADDEKVKHGQYKVLAGGRTLVDGQYKMNKRDSLWKTYARNGKVLSEKIYSQGEKKGVWSFYSASGVLEWQYDFENKKGSSEKAKPLEYAYQNESGQWVKEKADVEPHWLVSSYEWQSFMNRTLRYPQDALDANASGTPIIEVTVDENGNAMNYAVAKGAHPALDQEAIRIFKLFQPEFVPAEKNGKKVQVKVELPIVFRLEGG